eukprot:m.178645 g.178645  ORF g.178645 m.178645 type:complete len:369 (-) comp14640_c1_seq3:3249-4355(-)
MALDALLFDDPLELPVEPRDGFCNAHNIMEASGHLDQLLAGVGLDSIDLHTVCSTPKTAQHTINVVHALFRLYDDTLNHRVERESRMARLSDELRHAEEQNESLKDDKRTLERDVSQRDEAIRQLKKAEDAMAKDLKETKQQAKLARTNARQLAKQYSVEKRKMELQIIGLKDRLAKKLKPSSVTSALDEFHTINRSSGARGKWAKPKPSEAADAALQFAAQQGREEKIRELEEENLKMRTTLADLEGELAKVVHLRSDIGSGIPATNCMNANGYTFRVETCAKCGLLLSVLFDTCFGWWLLPFVVFRQLIPQVHNDIRPVNTLLNHCCTTNIVLSQVRILMYLTLTCVSSTSSWQPPLGRMHHACTS